MITYPGLPLPGSDAILLPGQRRTLSLNSNLASQVLTQAFLTGTPVALIPDLPVSSLGASTILSLVTVESLGQTQGPPTATLIGGGRLSVDRLERSPQVQVLGHLLDFPATSRLTSTRLRRFAASLPYRNQVGSKTVGLIAAALTLPPSDALDQLAIILDPEAVDLHAAFLATPKLEDRFRLLSQYVESHQAAKMQPHSPTTVTTFISLFENEAESTALFDALKARYTGLTGAVDFFIPPVRGLAFFTPDQHQLAYWWDRFVSADVKPVFLFQHDPGLPEALRKRGGLTDDAPVLIAAGEGVRTAQYHGIPDAYLFNPKQRDYLSVITDLYPALFNPKLEPNLAVRQPAFTLNVLSLLPARAPSHSIFAKLTELFASPGVCINLWLPPYTGAAFFQPQYQAEISAWWQAANQGQPLDAYYIFLAEHQADLPAALSHRTYDNIDAPVVIALDQAADCALYSAIPGVVYFLTAESDFIAALRELYPLSSLPTTLASNAPNQSAAQSDCGLSFDLLRQPRTPLPAPSTNTADLPPEVASALERITSEGFSRGNSDTLDTVKAICWTPPPPQKLDLALATDLINRSHYGLADVKDRILDLVATLVWSAEKGLPTTPQALCLVGPPGVGKTSIAKSLAAAINRRLEIISLGGVDDTFLTGTDRAYIRSRPGEIVRRLASNHQHPSTLLFLLDEIDKLATGGRSPYPPLLALLDPEQRASWRDQHLNEIPIDLSAALFITTANRVEDIPAPLLNRLDLLTLTDYPREEKLIIARDYILKEILAAHQLETIMTVPEATLQVIIDKYQSQSGMRRIQQALGFVTKRALRLHYGSASSFEITPALALTWLANSAPARTIGFQAGR